LLRNKFLAIALLLAATFSASAQAEWVEGSQYWRAAVAGTLAVTLAVNPLGADAAVVENAYGEDVAAYRVAWRWHWQTHQLASWLDVELFGQVAAEYWDGQSLDGDKDRNNLLVLTPVFRLQPDFGWSPYLEVSIGAALMSARSFPATGQDFGQKYQFEDTLALGWRWGERKQWDVALRYRHYSNNGMSRKNNGIDFNSLSISYLY